MILIAVLAVGGIATGGMIDQHSNTTTVINESHTLPSDWQNDSVSLNNNYTTFHNITVYNNNTAELTRGTDYYFNVSKNALSAADSAYAGNDVTVTYAYRAPDSERTQRIASLLAIFNPILGLLIVAAILGALLSLLGWWPS